MKASEAVAITYVPADCGSLIPGKSKAPQAFQGVGVVSKLRDAGISSLSEHHALDVPATYTAASFEPGSVRDEALNISVCQRVKDTISKNLDRAPAFQLILGGECCMLPAILSAFWQHSSTLSPPKRVGLLYIDADTDLSSPTDAGSTGNFAGMNMTHLVQVPGSLESMKQFSRPGGNPVVTSASIAREPEQRAKEALKYLEERVDVIMVHLDVDAIDPQMFPLANVPNSTGVSFQQMMRALGVLLASDKVGGLTIAEVNPDHDPGLEMVGRLTDEIVGILAARSSK